MLSILTLLLRQTLSIIEKSHQHNSSLSLGMLALRSTVVAEKPSYKFNRDFTAFFASFAFYSNLRNLKTQKTQMRFSSQYLESSTSSVTIEVCHRQTMLSTYLRF